LRAKDRRGNSDEVGIDLHCWADAKQWIGDPDLAINLYEPRPKHIATTGCLNKEACGAEIAYVSIDRRGSYGDTTCHHVNCPARSLDSERIEDGEHPARPRSSLRLQGAQLFRHGRR
jgi:hypothetical protein